jgi:1,4-dihydroxy-2-naphthoyl-CoA hydrolase
MSKNQKLKIINKVNNNTLMEHLNIEFIDVGNDYLTAKMPVSSKVHQPDGVLHGGATVALAESVGLNFIIFIQVL